MDSINQILQKLKDGEPVDLCDIYATVVLDGKQGHEQRLAALIAWVTNSAGSDSADALLAQIKGLIEDDQIPAIEAITTALTNVTFGTRLKVEPLGMAGVARSLAAGAATANTALTTTCKRVRLTAVSADIAFMIGSTAQTAVAATSHYLVAGTSADFALPATPNIAVIRGGATDGIMKVTELLEPA